MAQSSFLTVRNVEDVPHSQMFLHLYQAADGKGAVSNTRHSTSVVCLCLRLEVHSRAEQLPMNTGELSGTRQKRMVQQSSTGHTAYL